MGSEASLYTPALVGLKTLPSGTNILSPGSCLRGATTTQSEMIILFDELISEQSNCLAYSQDFHSSQNESKPNYFL